MAKIPKGRLVQGLYEPIHRACAMHFYLGVKDGVFVDGQKIHPKELKTGLNFWRKFQRKFDEIFP